MLAQIRQRIARFLGSRRRHEEAWEPVRNPVNGDFSPFQHECEQLILECLSNRGLQLSNRRVKRFRLTSRDPEESLLEADIPGLGAELALSASQTDIFAPSGGLCLEEWGTETPEEHLEIVRDYLEKLPLVSSQPNDRAAN